MNEFLKIKNEITCVFSLSINEGQFSEFRNLVSDIVKEAKKETGTLTYLYSISNDQKMAHIIERYEPEALIPHIDVTFSPFGERFLSLVKVTGLTVYGQTTAEMRKRLDAFGALYLTPFDGFSR